MGSADPLGSLGGLCDVAGVGEVWEVGIVLGSVPVPGVGEPPLSVDGETLGEGIGAGRGVTGTREASCMTRTAVTSTTMPRTPVTVSRTAVCDRAGAVATKVCLISCHEGDRTMRLAEVRVGGPPVPPGVSPSPS